MQFFASVEEAVWAIEVLRDVGVPIACTLRMGPTGDQQDVSPAECAIRMARAGSSPHSMLTEDGTHPSGPKG